MKHFNIKRIFIVLEQPLAIMYLVYFTDYDKGPENSKKLILWLSDKADQILSLIVSIPVDELSRVLIGVCIVGISFLNIQKDYQQTKD